MNRKEARAYFRDLGKETRIDDANARSTRREYLAGERESEAFLEAQSVVRKHATRIGSARKYFRDLGRELRGIDGTFRKEYLAEEKTTEAYRDARSILRTDAQEKHASRSEGEGRPIPERIVRAAEQTPQATVTSDEIAVPMDHREAIDQNPSTETANQETIRWAYSVIDGYRAAIPEKGTRKVKTEAANAYVREQLVEVIHDPNKLETAFGIWKANSDESSFYRSAKEKLPSVVGRHWDEISPKILGETVTKYARNGYVAQEFEEYLKGYFEGPKTTEDRVEAYYRYCDAALDLANDPESVRKAVEIGNFETDIMSRRGEMFQDVMLINFMGVYDPPLRQKASTAVKLVMTSLTRLVGFDRDEVMRKHLTAIEAMQGDPKFNHKRRHIQRLSVKGNMVGFKELYGEEIPTMGKVFGNSTGLPTDIYRQIMHGNTDLEAVEDLAGGQEEWLRDPLGKKVYDKVLGRSSMAAHKIYIAGEINASGEDVVFLTRQVDGVMLEVGIPASLAGSRDAILEACSASTENIAMVKDEGLPFVPVEGFHYDNKLIYATYRKIDEAENTNRHPLEMLNNIGFPDVASEDLEADNAALATQIVNEQRRFLNTRGFSIPLTHPALADRGYQNFTFKKNPDDNRVTDLTIKVRNTEIKVRLDQDFRFDLEGMECDVPQRESIHNIILTVLYPALCGLSAKDHDGNETDLSRIFQTRVGYIGYLGSGRNFTDKKAEEFFSVEGRDLSTVSEQRKSIDPTGQSRNSSYWAPVESDDPNLPPVRLNIGLPADKFKTIAPEAEQAALEAATTAALANIVFEGEVNESTPRREYVSPFGANVIPDVERREIETTFKSNVEVSIRRGARLEANLHQLELQQAEDVSMIDNYPEFHKKRGELEKAIEKRHTKILEMTTSLKENRDLLEGVAELWTDYPELAYLEGREEISVTEKALLVAAADESRTAANWQQETTVFDGTTAPTLESDTTETFEETNGHIDWTGEGDDHSGPNQTL